MKFFISDTHFGHANIIKYCLRPYPDVESMNETLIHNWNSSIGEKDEVYFLGDLCLSDFEYWWSRLNGSKILIRGNHDRRIPDFVVHYDRLTMCIDNIFLCLIHSPNKIHFNGWTIHGHYHDRHPLIFPERKLINVSVEALNYYPICLDDIMHMIKEASKTNDSTDK